MPLGRPKENWTPSSNCKFNLLCYFEKVQTSWQNLQHDKKLRNAFNNNLDHGDYENHRTWVGLFIFYPCCTLGTKSKQDF
jgi:hypothetical protein